VSNETLQVSAKSQGASRWLWLGIPLALLVALVAWLVLADPFHSFQTAAPPIEDMTFERTILDDDGISLLIRAGGSAETSVAQVQVDGAYWTFTQNPEGPLQRGETAWVHLDYPWVLGEAHHIAVLTSLGTIFEHEIPVAVPTPQPAPSQLWSQALVGIIVGIVPVAIGLAFYPFLRGTGQAGMTFLLALTIGLLAFLLVDMSLEAVELSQEAATLFQGPTMIVFAAAATFLLLLLVGRVRGQPKGLALAAFIAFGIGLHNFGEGLAIGAAFAAGSAGLGTFLILGFSIHNVTEGIGIAAPILKSRPPAWAFVGLTLLAGLPAVFGMWLGSLAFAPQWSALAMAIGIGAILQVIVEVSRYMTRNTGKLLSPMAIAGLIVGAAVMYVTAAAIAV
jgi:ZIP family zinc transporter